MRTTIAIESPRQGYREIPQFGQYLGEEFSVCFAKSL